MPAIKLTVNGTLLELNKGPLRQELRHIGRDVQRRTQALIRSGGSGRGYGAHTASTPGSAPASRTGNLARLIRVRLTQGGTAVRIVDDAWYAVALESGAKGTGGTGRGVIEPRPYLSQVLQAMEPEIATRIIRAVEQGITNKPMKKRI